MIEGMYVLVTRKRGRERGRGKGEGGGGIEGRGD